MDYQAIVEDFAKKLKQSEIYTDYLQAYEELCNDHLLKKQIDDYRNSLVRMQMTRDAGTQVSEDEDLRISNMYSQLKLNERGAYYLEKEQKLIKMLKDISETINSNITIDLSFLQ